MKIFLSFHLKDLIPIFLCSAFILLPSVLLLLAPAVYVPLWTSALSWRIYPRHVDSPRHAGSREELLNLERILRETAMQDKTVIITTLNQAWATQHTMIDLFLDSFRNGEDTERFLNHLLIVALDQKSYERCILIHSHCYRLRTNGVDFSGEKSYMTSDYLSMMWRRIDFLIEVLESGYSFVFTDADIMWFRDPFPHFSPEADFQVACDRYGGQPNSLKNTANGGFVFARSNIRTIEFYKYWYASREVFPNKHDQDVFNQIKCDDTLTDIGVRLRFLDTKYISGFCDPARDLHEVCTMHANCCYGLGNKLHDLRLILADWKRFRSMTLQEERFQKVSWSAPKACIHSKKGKH